jgi:hypothetical protein
VCIPFFLLFIHIALTPVAAPAQPYVLNSHLIILFFFRTIFSTGNDNSVYRAELRRRLRRRRQQYSVLHSTLNSHFTLFLTYFQGMATLSIAPGADNGGSGILSYTATSKCNAALLACGVSQLTATSATSPLTVVG